MKKHLFIFLFMTILLLVASSVRAQSGLCKALHDEITADLKNSILSFWEKYSVDPSGGFYGSLGRDGAPIADAPKGGVLNSRHPLDFFNRLSDVWRCCLPQTG